MFNKNLLRSDWGNNKGDSRSLSLIQTSRSVAIHLLMNVGRTNPKGWSENRQSCARIMFQGIFLTLIKTQRKHWANIGYSKFIGTKHNTETRRIWDSYIFLYVPKCNARCIFNLQI